MEASTPSATDQPAALDRAAILGALNAPLPPRRVEVPGLGPVYVSRLSAARVDQYQEDAQKLPRGLRRGVILSHAMCDEAGKRLFTTDDAAQLGGLDNAAAEPVVDAFLDANGLGVRKN